MAIPAAISPEGEVIDVVDAGLIPVPIEDPVGDALGLSLAIARVCRDIDLLSSDRLFGDDDLRRVAELALRTQQAIQGLRTLCERAHGELLGRLEPELNESGCTEKRLAGLIVSVVMERKAEKHPEFDTLCGQLYEAAQVADFQTEAAAAMQKVWSVNRTRLRSLVKAGGDVAEIAGQLFHEGEPKPKVGVIELTQE